MLMVTSYAISVDIVLRLLNFGIVYHTIKHFSPAPFEESLYLASLVEKMASKLNRGMKLIRCVPYGAQVSRQSTGNKPQMAQGGRDVIQINYYGSDYAKAQANPTQQMDPSKFTQPVVDILNGPALKSPTVEECGYSDRIAQLTAGNSTITTQEAANAVVAYGVWPSYTIGAGEAIDRLSEPGPEVDRFYTLDSVLWSTNTKGWFWKLPGCLTDLGMFGQNCAYHFLLRSGFMVHVQLNASKFHQGLVMVAAIPECESTLRGDSGDLDEGFFVQYPTAQIPLFPHQLINLRTNNSATLVLPYVNNFPAECPLLHNYWTVVIIPVVPLRYQTGASTEIPVTVSIAPMYSSFAGLRGSVTQGGVPVHTVPGSGQFMTTLRQSGYPIYPDFEPTHAWKIPGRVENLLEAARVDTFCKLSTVEGSLHVDVSQGKKDNAIFTFDMDLNSDAFSTTYLARLSQFFVNWRGSVRLTLTFCGSAMATGKFLVAYTPPGGDAPPNREQAMLGTHVIWDVGLQSSISFIIPWIGQTQYRYTAVNQNALSYAGFVTMWYQTAVVVPPGAPAYAGILGMLSATDDFVMRMPTDNAFYQGLGDELGQITDKMIHHSLQTLDIKAAPGASLPDGGTHQTGEAPALTATETGATAATQPGALMETREIPVTFSAKEMSVENFMSKYALFYYKRFSWRNAANTANWFTLPLEFAEGTTTQRAVIAKYRMFTYFRCDYDIVVLVSEAQTTPTQTLAAQLKFQIIYTPPGTAAPASQSSAVWDFPTTPSVYGSISDPPVSMRIPFVSPGNAYNVFYDGYRTFSETDYGTPPANSIGNLSFRVLNPTEGNVERIFTARFYARPINVVASIPRPLVSLKPSTTRLAASRHRYYYVDDDVTEGVVVEEHPVPRARSFGNSDVEMESEGEEEMEWEHGLDLQPLENATDQELVWLSKCIQLWSDETYGFHAIPITDTKAFTSAHMIKAWQRRNGFLMGNIPKPDSIEFDMTRDLAILRWEKPCLYPVPISDETRPERVTVLNEACFGKMGVSTFNMVAQEIEVEGNEDVPLHHQYGLIRMEVDTGPGWCGSPVFTEKGCIGFVTAGTPGVTLATLFHYCGNAWTVSPLPHRRKFVRKPWYRWTPYSSRVVGYIRAACEDMGRSFGSGVVEEVFKSATEVIPSDVDIGNGMVKKVITWLVKIVCGMVVISNAEEKLTTAAAVGVMLGIDIAMESPFEWLKNKVLDILGMLKKDIKAHFQGPIEWVKDFNAFCTAFRGLDWIGAKIQEFVDWLKRLFKKESPRRKKFMAQLEHLPELMESIDKAIMHRGRYSDEQVEKICQNMRTLKLGADVYGVERNFCTQQIVRYYAKAETLMRTCNKSRIEPVAICIHGGPGEGKSLATTIIAQKLCQRRGTGLPYSLPPDPKYFDGYSQQTAVIMDDVAQNPDGEDLKLFCQMVSSAPFQVPMASLEDKGMAFTSDYVLCSTNAQHLAPPTVAEPKALERRFFLDVDIVVKRGYSVCGRLDAARALQQCNGESECACFKVCTPICCGRAIAFKDRHTKVEYSIDKIILLMESELSRRKNCGNMLAALFQGPNPTPAPRRRRQQPTVDCPSDPFPSIELDPPNMWLQSDFDMETCILKDAAELKRCGLTQPCPKEVADLIRAVPDPKVIDYCEKQGWIVPVNAVYERTKTAVGQWLSILADSVTVLAGVSSIVGVIYLIYSMMARYQGAYSGKQAKAPPKPPVVRRAVPQGPQQDFGTKLFSTNLVRVKTENGPFSGLGLYGQWLLLPRHADPGDEVEIEDVKFQVIDQVELTRRENTLELVAIKINRPVNFRDLRRYFLASHHTTPGCVLLVNTDMFPRTMMPVGTVHPNGLLRLDSTMVDNTCRYGYPTRSGQCGGIVITPDNKIIAMHIGGDGWNGYGALIYAKYFDKLDEAQAQGQLKNPRPAPRSININRRTVLRPSVFHDVFEGSKEPAALSGRDPRLKVELDAAMFGKYKGNCQVEEPTENMLLAVDHYVSQIQPILPPNVTIEMTLDEVVYGAEGLDGLDLNTSAGFPYNTMGIKKKDLIPRRGEPLTELTKALDLHGFDLPFSTYLKDELRPLEKVRLGKTRLIECSSVNDTIRMKQRLGRLFATYHQNPGVVTGCAVGCDPDRHWSKFYAEMGDQPLLAFDYSNYDASLSPVWFTCLKLVLTKLGFQADDLIDHICNSTHIYGGIQYDVEGGMPSGCSGTSIFNSIINNLIIRTVVLDVYSGIELDALRIIAYGDDVIASYPFPLDASLLAKAGAVYGLTMTPADKSETFGEVTWETVTFLKRKFCPDETFPFLIHPVFPFSEVSESIRWCRSAAYTQEHVLSLCYLVWHSGEEVYQDFVNRIRSVPVGRALFIPSFSVLRHEWLEKF
nr:polyprotein [Maser virus]